MMNAWRIRWKIIRYSSVLYCVPHLCTAICTHIWAVLTGWFTFGHGCLGLCLIFFASAHKLTSKQPAPLPAPWSILNLTNVILCITTFQTINLTGSNRFNRSGCSGSPSLLIWVLTVMCLLSVRRPSIRCVSFDEYAAHSILSRQRRLSMLS